MPALQNLELDNGFLPAELRRDADKFSLMRRSVLELRSRLSRGKYAKARLAVLMGALNVVTDGNYLRLYLCTSLAISKPGYRKTVGGIAAAASRCMDGRSLRTLLAGSTGFRREHRRNGLGREHRLRRNGLGPSRAREQQPQPISSGI
jgi:hypothetical protein